MPDEKMTLLTHKHTRTDPATNKTTTTTTTTAATTTTVPYAHSDLVSIGTRPVGCE